MFNKTDIFNNILYKFTPKGANSKEKYYICTRKGLFDNVYYEFFPKQRFFSFLIHNTRLFLPI